MSGKTQPMNAHSKRQATTFFHWN